MIYLLTKQEELFDNSTGIELPYTRINQKDALELVDAMKVVQFDTETNGRDPHLCSVLCAQFGNKALDSQLVVDTTTLDLNLFKKVLESKLLIGHNLKFDYQFLYNYHIVPRKTYDTMIIEQLLHLGYDNKYFHYGLKDVAFRRLGIDIDKSTRGEIIWRGLDPQVVKYAAGDVMYLEDIMEKQMTDVEKANCIRGAKIENAFVAVIAYLEWCGIKLDINLWHEKMLKDENSMKEWLTKLNQWLVGKTEENAYFLKYTNYQPDDLFRDMFPLECIINWGSSQQVTDLAKELGFNTKIEDKETGEDKDSVVAKHLKKQKGVCDDFLVPYLNYKEASKVCSTYGQTYIDAINPVTGRIHTQFRQLGADSGRMSCGSKQTNTDLAKFKHMTKCGYMQLQNLPKDKYTRAAFVSEPGNLMTSCDYSALESRLGADIYNEQAMIREYLEGSGDIHSLTAKACFPKELEGIAVKDIEHIRPDLRQRAKPVEFSQQFGGSAKAIQNSLGCTYKEAKEIAEAYKTGFPGIATFKEKGSRFVRQNGYIVICKATGHKLYWENWKQWRKIEDLDPRMMQAEYTPDEIKKHNMEGSKWDRLALNVVTQGTGIIILKLAMVNFFKWICDNGLFNKVLLCNLIHDEAVIEYPKELEDTVVPKLKECMESAAAILCKKLPIPAKPETGDHWIH
jgi:DNA polymerase I-like protein with 3'-5' exonuclease and polymerase domains